MSVGVFDMVFDLIQQISVSVIETKKLLMPYVHSVSYCHKPDWHVPFLLSHLKTTNRSQMAFFLSGVSVCMNSCVCLYLPVVNVCEIVGERCTYVTQQCICITVSDMVCIHVW